MKRFIVPSMMVMMMGAGAALAQTSDAVRDDVNNLRGDVNTMRNDVNRAVTDPSITPATNPASPMNRDGAVMDRDGKMVGKNGGFVNAPTENMTPSTVSQIRDMKDDQPIVLRGQIVEKKDDNTYLFKDGTDEINLKIANDKWNGLTVNPGDMVEVGGEVDKGLLSNAVNVDWIKKQ